MNRIKFASLFTAALLLNITKLFSQTCNATILQKDTAICAGSSVNLNLAIVFNNNNCNTYSISSSLQNGLIGWYPFCGNTNDIGPQQNNGVAIGDLTYAADRYNDPNTAIKFTGSGECVHTFKIDRTTVNSFSYVVWINTDNTITLPKQSINPSSGYGIDLSSTTVIDAVHGNNWNTNAQHTGAGLYIAKNGVFVLEHTASIVATPLAWNGNLSGWHSVAVVYNNHLPKLYIDGQFVQNGLVTSYTTHPSCGCDSVFLNGTYPYIATGFGKGFNPTLVDVPLVNFKGSIDDIKIYGRALTDAEISELYSKDKYNILWSTGETGNEIAVTPDRSSKYSVTVSDGITQCSSSVNIEVKQPAAKEITTSICAGDSYEGYTTTGTYTNTFTAVNGCDSVRTLNLTVNPQPTSDITMSICEGENYAGYSTTGKYTDTFKLASVNGCDSIRTLQLTVNPRPHPALGKDTILCAGDKLLLSPGSFDTYLWQDGSTQSSFTVTKGGEYTVSVTNDCGSATDNKVITDTSCQINFPSAFTPNNDGHNDEFKIIRGFNLTAYHLIIFNRWGQLVFETYNPLQGWDGKLNGALQGTGTFVWRSEYTSKGKMHQQQGTVILIR